MFENFMLRRISTVCLRERKLLELNNLLFLTRYPWIDQMKNGEETAH
jgi:hypothetical protein